jgi:hypothetical protein
MSHLENEKQKLVARIKRIRGQVDSIERYLTAGDKCADVLMLLANHLLSSEKTSAQPASSGERSLFDDPSKQAFAGARLPPERISI